MMSGEKRTAKKAMATQSSSGKKAKVVAETVTIDTELLECGFCLTQLAPPLFQCTKGHITCSDCCADLEYQCQMCPEPETNFRCRVMERVLDGLTVPCSFRQHGCTRMIPYAERERLIHDASCFYAPCYCPVAGCCCSYTALSLLEHIELQHPTIQRTRVKPACLTPLEMREGEPARVLCLGNDRALFLVVVDRSVPSGRSLSVLVLVTEPFQEEDFKYKIKVFAKAGILAVR